MKTKTSFPSLRAGTSNEYKHSEDSLGFPDLEFSDDEYDSEDDDSSWCSSFCSHSGNDEYRTKEDQDVAMFLGLVERMAIPSVLFILQNHAREVHKIPEQQLQQAIGGASCFKTPSATAGAPSSPKRAVVKKFRFAEIMGGTQIREKVFEIPHLSELTQEDLEVLWWTKDEQQHTRTVARKAVKLYSNHKPAYQESVEYLVDSYHKDPHDILVEHHIKKLAKDSFARGLECHIVPSLVDHREAGIEAVLAEQDALDLEGIDQSDPVAEERIRRRYRQVSLPYRAFSRQLARCDHIEALKCSLSSWASDYN